MKFWPPFKRRYQSIEIGAAECARIEAELAAKGVENTADEARRVAEALRERRRNNGFVEQIQALYGRLED